MRIVMHRHNDYKVYYTTEDKKYWLLNTKSYKLIELSQEACKNIIRQMKAEERAK